MPDKAHMLEFIYSLMELSGARAVLEIGCGKGYDLAQIGHRVGDAARLVGIDNRETALVDARLAVGKDSRFTLMQADVAKGLPFPDETFDLVYSKNLLECIVDKDAHLREVYRVLKPGGQVVYAHFDWDSQLFDGTDKALVRKIVQTFNDWQQAWMADCDAWMGRRLWRTFQRSGLFTGAVHPFVITDTHYAAEMMQNFQALVRRGMISQQEYETFMTEQADFAARDEFFSSITMYVYVGRKGSA
ncbi:MAG TPA: methyltransferase domain-containing protein [Armatimonadota bacterium]